jgi:hypothetical protein
MGAMNDLYTLADDVPDVIGRAGVHYDPATRPHYSVQREQREPVKPPAGGFDGFVSQAGGDAYSLS